uniref:FMRFamide-like neuropeptide n=1 Tax=Manduca sexta TaxID=7130 RepID=FARP_MANSE|nr:RecName: Full=FMRFamide-like neuropeptide [Manduca sexta]
QDVVHSFLRF